MRKLSAPKSWIGPAVSFLVGLLSVGLWAFGWRYGTTPKEALTITTGPMYGSELFELHGRWGKVNRFLKFKVRGYRTEYADSRPNFERLLAAARTEEIVTVGVSTRRETVFARKDWMPLYTLSIGSDEVVTYESTVSERGKGTDLIGIVGTAFLLFGGWGLLGYSRHRNLPSETRESSLHSNNSPSKTSGQPPVPKEYDY